jgi:hypothetical protein
MTATYRVEMRPLLVLMAVLACSTRGFAQGTPVDTALRRSVQADIVAIGGKPAAAAQGAVLELLYQQEGIDVKVRAEGVRPDEQVWLLAKNRDDGQQYQVYGPAVRRGEEEGDVWLVPDVVLPHSGSSQTKHFTLRAAVLSNSIKIGPSVTSVERFSAVSSPGLDVAVLKWIPTPARLSIDTVDGRPVEPRAELVVEASADVAGTRSVSGTSGAERSHVYLVLHPVNSNSYTLVGPAEGSDSGWFCRDVRFAGSGQPHWRYVDLFAVQSWTPLTPGPISDGTRLQRTARASHSVRVFVKDEHSPPAQRTASIELTGATTSAGTVIAIPPGTDRMRINDVDLSLNGTVRDLGQGKGIFAVLNPIGSSKWLVQEGPALISGTRWTLPRVRLEAPGDKPSSQFRMVIVAADGALPAGQLDYVAWEPATSGASRSIVLQRTDTTGRSASTDRPSIRKVAGASVSPSSTVSVSGAGPIEVQADGLPDAAQVWVGYTDFGSDEWTFVRATREGEDTWISRPMLWDTPSTHSSVHTVVAIVTRGPLPVQHGTSDWWQPYVWAISPWVTVTSGPMQPADVSLSTASMVTFPGRQLAWLWAVLAPWVVVLMVLVILEYLLRIVSRSADIIGLAAQHMSDYLKDQITDLPRISAVRSVLGLILAGLGLFAISWYFSIYQHVLRSVLDLSNADSYGLAILFVVFTAMVGILIDVTARFGSTERDGQSILSLFFYVAALTVLTLIAAALLMFQGIVYMDFYQSRAAVASHVPFAFGTAALFIAAVEMLSWYWASRLAFECVVWIVVHLVFIPPQLVKLCAKWIGENFRALPSRYPKAETTDVDGTPRPSYANAAK